VALRQGGTLYYLLTDHLGSTALTVDSSGVKVGELRYRAYGETRYTWGTTPTSRRFTGQLEEGTIGLYDYGARFYDPLLGRFLSADTVVPNPDNPQAFNRYSYCLNNPLRYVDPTGHDENDFYVFVQGGGGLWTDFWKHFLEQLKAQFGDKVEDWDAWVGSHVAYTNYDLTGNTEGKARDFSNWLQSEQKIQDWADKFPGGGIHLVGHSMGGLVIMEYLRGLMHGTSGISWPKQGIKSASILDSPLDNAPTPTGFTRFEIDWETTYSNGVPTGIRRVDTRDRLAGLGAWAKDRKIIVVTVSYDPSLCDHNQVDTIPHWSIPWQPGRPLLPGPAHSYVVDEPENSGSFSFLWDQNNALK